MASFQSTYSTEMETGVDLKTVIDVTTSYARAGLERSVKKGSASVPSLLVWRGGHPVAGVVLFTSDVVGVATAVAESFRPDALGLTFCAEVAVSAGEDGSTPDQEAETDDDAISDDPGEAVFVLAYGTNGDARSRICPYTTRKGRVDWLPDQAPEDAADLGGDLVVGMRAAVVGRGRPASSAFGTPTSSTRELVIADRAAAQELERTFRNQVRVVLLAQDGSVRSQLMTSEGEIWGMDR